MTKILVLGGDGYLGWPLALSFAEQGNHVTIMDNLAKRKWEMECGSMPLFEVFPIHRRVLNFKEQSGKEIQYFIGDVTNVGALYHIFDTANPDVVIHCAGQPSGPFSMRNRASAIITQENSYLGTINVLFAVQRAMRPVHLVVLGSMGAYGISGNIRDGSPEVDGGKEPLLFTNQPESFQQLANANVSVALSFASRNWELSITELRLGLVYGFWTTATSDVPSLQTSFYYDAVFGTVANRFSVQAAIGHPLTIYGSGRQERAFLSLQDMVYGVGLTVADPPAMGTFRVLNHFSEVMSVEDLSERMLAAAKRVGLTARVKHVPNRRVERDVHPCVLEGSQLKDMGLNYKRLEQILDENYFRTILNEKDRIDLDIMESYIPWRKH